MSPYERSIIRDNDFEFCWKFLWNTSGKGRRVLEFEDSKTKFIALKSAICTDIEGSEEYEFDRIMRKCEGVLYEPEWGFPKGRRNINESDMKTAFREFSEETGIPTESLMLLSHTPFEETFRGSNSIKYKHVYYLARADDSCKIILCPTELRDYAWLDVDNSRSKFTLFPERIRMLDRVHDYTIRMGCSFGIM
jgi:8-oxo-dGTP pyrophosphatase MutT (NUDIX family)